MAPTIVEMAEFEGLMAEVASGRSLVSLLERKTQPEWERHDVDGDIGAAGDLGRANQEQRFSRTMDQLLGRLRSEFSALAS